MTEITKKKMSKEEERWEAESDARTLSNAEVIKQDPDRMKKAIQAAKRITEDKQKEVDSYRNLANSKTLLTK